MLPTFVIGLREGLEASLIVGIVAAFLAQRGRRDLLRLAFLGVAAAVVLCLAVGIALDLISRDLPQRQQEGMETVIGLCAVTMVTYMVVWMRRHSRTLKAQLEGAASDALAAGSGLALVAMAFLAVLREGLETVVFLLAAFNESGSGVAAGLGAALGIAVAVVLGWGIYRGGVRLNLGRFFRFTGVVLTLVAAGLVVTALHTAHEAGWLTIGQQSTVDLSALVRPGSVSAALLTGMLGVQPHPVLIEVIGWLVYIVPVGAYVAWPPGRIVPRRAAIGVGAGIGSLALVTAIVLAALIPDRPASNPVTRAGDGASAQLVSRSSRGAVVDATVVEPGVQPAQPLASQRLQAVAQGSQRHLGVETDVYTASVSEPVAGQARLSYADLAQRNGGRLPLGVRAGTGNDSAPVQVTSVDVATFWVVASTGRIVDIQWRQTSTLTALFPIGPSVIGTPTTASWQLPAAAGQVTAARSDASVASRHAVLVALTTLAFVLGGAAIAIAALLALGGRRRRDGRAQPASTPIAARAAPPASQLVGS